LQSFETYDFGQFFKQAPQTARLQQAQQKGHPSSTANPDFSRFRLSGLNKIKH
jgi:hypothetical protein